MKAIPLREIEVYGTFYETRGIGKRPLIYVDAPSDENSVPGGNKTNSLPVGLSARIPLLVQGVPYSIQVRISQIVRCSPFKQR